MKNGKTKKELVVSAIDNGTVIDHIPSKSVFQVIKILNLEKTENQFYLGTNLASKKYGNKGIIKVRNKFFKIEEIDKISLVAPTATIITIKNFKVIKKKNVHIPDHVVKFVKCFNPNCITNHQNITTKFDVISKDELKLKCYYCEKITTKENMNFI